MSDFVVDFSKNTNYNQESSIQDVRWGAGGPVTEMELNEAQKIQTTQRRNAFKALFKDGFLSAESIIFENSILRIQNAKAILSGYIIDIDSITFTPTENKTVYLNAWLEEVNGNGTLYKNGNVQGATIPNYIFDSRFNNTEITRRNQLLYNLLDDNFKSDLKLEIGTLNSDGTFNFTYNKTSLTIVDEKANLVFKNIEVDKANFVEYTAELEQESALIVDFPYKADIPLTDVDENYYAKVNFGYDAQQLGIFSSLVNTFEGNVRIYSSEVPENNIIIPLILCDKLQ